MNNLVAFLKRNFHFIVFLILQIICFVMIYNHIHYPRFMMGRIARVITYPVNKSWNNLVKHFSLEEENRNLLEQNMELLRERDNNFILFSDTIFAEETRDEKNKRIRLYDYTTANVIYNTTTKKHNYLILDKGTNEGIDLDMAVFSAQGVVGVVNDVSSNFATVMSVLHPDTRISAKIMPADQIGTVIWEDHDPETVFLHDIPQHIMVNIGDSVITSGFSNVFPKDIMIGTVTEIENNTKNSFYTIKLKLSTNFNHLNSVYIVKNLYKNEIDSLKSNFKHE